MTDFHPDDIQKAAPLPYNTVEGGLHSGGHIYLTDKNGRKIGVVWGKPNEKPYTAALIIAAVEALVSPAVLAKTEGS